MKRKQLFLIALLALVMSVSLFAAGNSEKKVQSGELDRSKYFITVATGPTSGLYYPSEELSLLYSKTSLAISHQHRQPVLQLRTLL